MKLITVEHKSDIDIEWRLNYNDKVAGKLTFASSKELMPTPGGYNYENEECKWNREMNYGH